MRRNARRSPATRCASPCGIMRSSRCIIRSRLGRCESRSPTRRARTNSRWLSRFGKNNRKDFGMLLNLLRRFFVQRKSARLLAEAQRLFREGAFEEAERAGAECAKLSPDLADVHYLRASIALAPQRNESAALHFTRTLEVLPPSDPTRPRTMLRLAAALQDCNKQREAEQWYRRILDVDPGNRDALLCLAVLRDDSVVEEARSMMDRYTVLLDGAAPRLRRALMLPAILQSSEEIDRIRQRLDRELDELLDRESPRIPNPEFEVGATPFNLAYHGRDDSALMRKLGRVVRSLYAARTALDRRPLGSGGRIRIGFVSAYFYTHSIARTTHGLIKDLPRDVFEVHVFAIAPRTDDWSETIRRSADRYAGLPLDLGRAREAIESSALDILFYADLGIDPLTYFLAFWRLAPIQLVTWGHPVTTGIDTIDYFVSAEALETQGSENQYTERLIRLPGYFQPRYPRPAPGAPRKSREELGLPADKHLYCCLQNLFKLHPDFDAAIKAILERDSQAELVLLEFLRPSTTEQLRRRFDRTL